MFFEYIIFTISCVFLSGVIDMLIVGLVGIYLLNGGLFGINIQSPRRDVPENFRAFLGRQYCLLG